MKKRSVWRVTKIVLGRNTLQQKLSHSASEETTFLQPNKKQRQEQESITEIAGHLPKKGTVTHRVVSGFQLLAKYLSGLCFKILLSALEERIQVPVFRSVC